MRASRRRRPKNGKRRAFGLTVFFLAMMPTPIGLQDLAALIASQPAVSDRWRQYVRVTPFGTVQAATFSFPQPLGSMIPMAPGYTFASLDPRSLDITGSINPGNNPFFEAAPQQQIQFPTVNRALKGDLLVRRERPAPAPVAPKQDRLKKAPEKTQDRAQFEQPKPVEAAKLDRPEAKAPAPQPKVEAAKVEPAKIEPAKPAIVETAPAQPEAPKEAPKADVASETKPLAPVAEMPSGMDLEFNPQAAIRQAEAELPPGMDLESAAQPQIATQPQAETPVADASPGVEAEPQAKAPDVADNTPLSGMDVEFKLYPNTQTADGELLTDEEPADTEVAVRSAIPADNPADRLARLFFGADSMGPQETTLQPWREGEAPVLMPMHPSIDPDIKRAAIDPEQKLAALAPDAESEGQTVAPKGEVTGEGKRPMTPAERLGLTGASRAKHERCLTNAIYFESRGESERGQMAVAQVVLNRAFSGYYPNNICGVVYQNAHRHLACQFTFACDGIRDVVTEPDAWEVAKRIARDTLDGKIWLPEIGKSTHYHAYWVRPSWVNEMKKLDRLGVHTFYRPRAWGDGSDAPAWGSAASMRPSAAAARM